MTWKDRLKLAKQSGSFTKEDKELVRYFGSCAIGEKLGLSDTDITLHNKILYSLKDEPWKLGYYFARNVGSNNIRRAYELYLKIQKLGEPLLVKPLLGDVK